MHNEKGQEIPDPTPVEVPLNFRRPPSLNERIRSMIAREMSQYASAQGAETFEEANDFEVDEDPDFKSPYEVTELQEEAGFHDADNGDKNGDQNPSSVDTPPPPGSPDRGADQGGKSVPTGGAQTDAAGRPGG